MTRSSKPLRPADGTPPSADELACERVQDPADVAEEWDALALASGNIFATREFLELWRHHVVTDRELLIIVCREMPAGRAVGILPLYRWGRFPLSVVRFLGHGAGDELGPICAPADIPRVVQALQRALIDEAPHLFVGERMRPAPLGILSGARTITSEGYPIVSLAHADWDAYLASRSSNFRQQLRRRERRLEQQHELRYRALSPCDFELCFDLLVSLHRARWGPRTSFLASVDFHRDFARLALEHGWLRLWFMELEGTPVAAWYGFQFSGVMSYYQAGRDPAWEHASVGLLLLAHTIREALSEGLGEYRLLRGGEGYKYRFTDDDPGLETLVVARGLFAAGAVRTLELTRLLRRQLRAPRASHRRPADGRPT